MNSLGEVAGLLLKSNRFLICGHLLPDGDSLGSSLALALALKGAGKEVLVASPDLPPDSFSFLPAIETVATVPNWGRYETFVAVDCSTPDRLGQFKTAMEAAPTVVNIDHHTGTAPFGTYNYVDPRAAATGEILFDLLELMGLPISVEIATCLYVAIITDTGQFKYEQTTADTHRRVAKLIELGVPAVKVNTFLYDEKPLVAVKLLQIALASLELSPCGKVAWLTVTKQKLNDLGAEDQHAEGLINHVREIKGVEVAMVFREMEHHQFKVSFRSKRWVDVSQLAGSFGGGGHPKAAGCVLSGNLHSLVNHVVATAIKAVSL